jgi:hypothetical protein
MWYSAPLSRRKATSISTRAKIRQSYRIVLTVHTALVKVPSGSDSELSPVKGSPGSDKEPELII